MRDRRGSRSHGGGDICVGRGDYALAERLFRPLAEKGDAKAQFNLDWMYYMGQRVTQNALEAARWYRKAAEQGLIWAQLNLGWMYADGQGVPQDFVRAHMWTNVAAATSSGDEGKISRESRDFVAKQMTAAQIEKAQEMAWRCQDTNFKECD